MLLSALGLLGFALIYVGVETQFVPCTLDCGETYESHIAARNLHRFGLRYTFGLQDLAAGPEQTAHPAIYTHNPNVGMYLLYLLLILGLHDLHAQVPWVAIPFGFGLLYLYLFLRKTSGDGALAGLALLTAATLYLLVALWGFSPLRSFSWLLTFGPLYHLGRYGRPGRRRLLHLLVTVAYLVAAIGIDYPFAVFLAITVVMLGALRLIPVPASRLAVIVGLSLGVAFLLRQIQVLAALGPEFWAMDFIASVARRVPLAGLIFGVPDEATQNAMYEELKIVKWPGGGAFTPRRWLLRLVGPYWYVLGTPFLVLGVAWGMALLVMRRADARHVSRSGGRPAVVACYLALALGSGIAGSFLIFADYVSTFYGFVLMPMVVHWVVVLLALASYLLLAHRRARMKVGRYVIPVGALALAGFIVWRAGIEIRNYILLPPRPYPGQAALREIERHSAVTLWISSAVSAYTGQWAASLNGTRWTNLRPSDLPFDPSLDYYVFMEADRDNPQYRRPDFFFVPALNVRGFDPLRCRPPRGWIATYADGCSNLEEIASRLGPIPLYRRGEDFLLYDLRKLYPPS